MKISDQFAAAVRPVGWHFADVGPSGRYGGGRSLSISFRKLYYEGHLRLPSGNPSVKAVTEEALLLALLAEAPDLFSWLNSILPRQYDPIIASGLLRRFELLYASPADMLSKDMAFERTTIEIAQTVMRHLDAPAIKMPKLLRERPSRAACWWKYRFRVVLPHLTGVADRVDVIVKMFPSPVTENALAVRVQAHVLPDALVEVQSRVADAFSELASNGIQVSDVLQGTKFDFS